MMEVVVFVIAATVIVLGALGVVLLRHPVHAALALVQTLFGVAVLFIAQDAHFLAAVQVIVYAGAIVVLFLFVIMLLGVDQIDNIRTEPLVGQRPMAALAGVSLLALLVASILRGSHVIRDASVAATEPNINRLAKSLFTDYVFAFEVTSVLLVVAVVGAVVLARRPSQQGPSQHGPPTSINDEQVR
jgi:NADH-quinone oxidoreductase subunit J